MIRDRVRGQRFLAVVAGACLVIAGVAVWSWIGVQDWECSVTEIDGLEMDQYELQGGDCSLMVRACRRAGPDCTVLSDGEDFQLYGAVPDPETVLRGDPR